VENNYNGGKQPQLCKIVEINQIEQNCAKQSQSREAITIVQNRI